MIFVTIADIQFHTFGAALVHGVAGKFKDGVRGLVFHHAVQPLGERGGSGVVNWDGSEEIPS